MGKIDNLIQQLCPNGVEYKTLGEIGTFFRGNGFQKKDLKNSGRPCIHYGQIYTHYGAFSDNTISYLDEETYAKSKLASTNDLIIAITSENIEDVCKTVAWLGEDNVAVSGHIAVFHHHENPKYLSYYFQTASFFEQKEKYAHGTKVMEISPNQLSKISIPVPPLAVQSEIVKYLDDFTELTAELTAELELRKKQYEYYRDKLLSFNEIGGGIKWIRMRDIMNVCRGASPRPIRQYITNESNGIPWIKIGDVSPTSKYITSTEERITPEGAAHSRYLKKGDFILSNSMSFGRPYILQLNGCIHDGWIALSGYENYASADYLYHVLRSSSIQKYWVSKANSGGAVANLNADIIRDTVIPLPTLEEQANIVAVLDRFDKICNDLTAGLPAEIQARQQQYEYYRDKLLTFNNL